MGRFDALLNPTKPVSPTKIPVEGKAHMSASPQVDMSTKQQNHLPSSPQVDTSASMQSYVAVSPQGNTSTSGQADLSTHEKTERYTTRLQPHLIKLIKRYAFEHEIHDYDVVQNAIQDYLEKHT